MVSLYLNYQRQPRFHKCPILFSQMFKNSVDVTTTYCCDRLIQSSSSEATGFPINFLCRWALFCHFGWCRLLDQLQMGATSPQQHDLSARNALLRITASRSTSHPDSNCHPRSEPFSSPTAPLPACIECYLASYSLLPCALSLVRR